VEEELRTAADVMKEKEREMLRETEKAFSEI
jgi:hypothetical protein